MDLPAPPSAATAAVVPAPRSAPPPEVAQVIQAQEDVGALWKNLERIFKARPKLEEAPYQSAVIAAVHDFLRLPDAARPGFEQSLAVGALRLAEIRKEHELAKQALPPKDKSNPVYVQQKEALDRRTEERTRAVVDGVAAHLDPRDARHAEFAGRLEKLLRYLGPR